MNTKLVLVDLDGTLLGKDQVKVSERNLQALHALHERGCEIVPCTGRAVDMLAPELLALPFIRYVVSSHGARVYDRVTDQTLYSCLISPEDSAKVLAVLEGRGLYAEVAADHTIYIEKATEAALSTLPVPSHHVWYMCEDHAYTAVDKPSQYFLEHGIGIEKVNLYGIPDALTQEIYDGLTATGVIRHTRGAAAKDLEFSAKNLDKAAAMDVLLRHLGLTYDQTFAIGDSSTDRDVIRMSRIGVAMGNAPEDIQAVADHVTARNTEDGFALAVEQYLLGEERM